jgi:hypothetical protein
MGGEVPPRAGFAVVSNTEHGLHAADRLTALNEP